ncbi:hypothetical protein [Crateriforma spongiae]|uniref:hypothetical protein n=1 Tax=Crateriforma spongiae TaxID=2724528 RepID=UPI0039AEE1CF
MSDRRKNVLSSLAVVTLLSIPLAAYLLLQIAWFGPARVYADAQARCETVFAENEWSGYPLWFHYDYRVRFVCPELGTV